MSLPFECVLGICFVYLLWHTSTVLSNVKTRRSRDGDIHFNKRLILISIYHALQITFPIAMLLSFEFAAKTMLVAIILSAIADDIRLWKQKKPL